ncbi:uncharacterized protein LAESUDRAFT_712628 [Laetiporus sulphureus 93-53]|uniref:Uncharacterized protein n=1 Tax=Laetiporus sulphureus 93-53 TaxID=1314785 RepID=A0A165FJH8_9APHY|nr:uncharacterized protein LAESUDRAFT_712628 [Laetiporus sulphureus 93-53]KZT09065.1 hypothetical protein LAESUDRAFT_712628 [Laetiporus sulphureus 93-53]
MNLERWIEVQYVLLTAYLNEDGRAKYSAAQAKLKTDPRAVLNAALRVSLAETVALSESCVMIPDKISPNEILDVFLRHLHETRVPAQAPNSATRYWLSAVLAYTAMYGLNRIHRKYPFLLNKMASAWPGVLQWSVFFFSGTVTYEERIDSKRRGTIEQIASACIETAAKLWMEESEGPLSPNEGLPTTLLMIENLLKLADAERLDRVIKAAGGNASIIAKLSLSRLQDTLTSKSVQRLTLAMYLRLLCHLSCSPCFTHPMLAALLSENVIWTVTKALLVISVYVDLTIHVSACHDGFTWVSQAVGAGLLHAWVDCSPQFDSLDSGNQKMFFDVVGDVLSRYMVYLSVVEAVNASMSKIRETQKERVRRSLAKDVWDDFVKLSAERFRILRRLDAQKGQHMCSNENVRRHALSDASYADSILVSYSRHEGADPAMFGVSYNVLLLKEECQANDWKEGDHKNACKLTRQGRKEGRPNGISKRDVAFLRLLAMTDSRKHLPLLRELAKREFSDTPLPELAVCIDYTVVPPAYTLKLLKTYEIDDANEMSLHARARQDGMIEKVREISIRRTLIEGTIVSGSVVCYALMHTNGTHDFWTLDEAASSEGSLKDEQHVGEETSGIDEDESEEGMHEEQRISGVRGRTLKVQ